MIQKKSIWITYAWDDNKYGDVDFIAQEFIKTGFDVKLDRWVITAGKRLWEQIESNITDSAKSTAWLIYATQASFGSEACKEEFYYALDRALHSRGNKFPIIALFPASVDASIIPAGIKIRLYVNLTDPDWKKRIIAAVEGREVEITKINVEPYYIKIYELEKSKKKPYVIEVRPRAGTWSPFICAIPISEKNYVVPELGRGSINRIPWISNLNNCRENITDDNNFYFISAQNEATPTQSYYLFCRELPSILIFGVEGSQPQYQVLFKNESIIKNGK